ncbi:MCE family protein [Antrihabitans sp. YC3-6]|uniref:MCE family protein n=2 Tax=Antrihabitans stalagmiti TaxID=2799499 RepID=A0A934NPJ9_9NOCA|nr:MCE family protein [Antrihabitans stalagmiti]
MNRQMRQKLWRPLVAMAVAATLAALSGCAIDPSTVPVPGTTVSGETYRVQIELANALNLPARAKVLANGAQIGTVAGVHVVDPTADTPVGYVVVDIDVSESVRLPRTTRAELRQNTILGDIHIAVTTPPDGFGDPIPPDGVIPIEQTKPPVQIEDTMAGMALFVQGGAITQLQDIVKRVNAVLPQDPRETARIADTVGSDIQDLSRNLDQVDALLDSLVATSAAVQEDLPVFADILTEPTVQHIADAVASIAEVVGVLGALGEVGVALQWLGPLITEGDAAAKAFVPLAFTRRPFDLDAPSNLNLLVSLLRDKVIPFVERGPKVNVVGVTTTDAAAEVVSSDDQVDRILQTLRMIGAVR